MTLRFRLLCCSLVAFVGLACGKVQVDDSDAAPDDQCLPTYTLCGTECVDTQTSHANCGACGEACGADQVCDQADCVSECSGGLDACDGSCVDTDTNDAYCGSCTNACAADQVCREGSCDDLETVATLEITSRWPEATGWMLHGGNPISMNFADPGVTGTIFECRTGPESVIGSMAFTNCDGGNGTGTTYRPAPVTGMEEGSYRTDVRLRRGAWVGDAESYEFYVHRSLDLVEDCNHPFTDEQIFTKAASELTASVTFDPATVVKRPFVHIPFKSITVNFGLKGGGGWANVNTGDAYDADVLSLRRRFVLSADRRYLLIHRVFESRMQRREFNQGSCANNYYFGTRRPRDCPFFVLNANGVGVCLAPDAGNPGQLVNTRGTGNTFDDAWVKLARRDSYHKEFYGKRTTPCPSGCQDWEIYLPE